MDVPAQRGESVVAIENEPCHHLVLVNEYVRGLAVEVPPFHQTLCHHHPHDYVLYVAGISDVRSTPVHGEAVRCLYRDGECEFLPAGLIHKVENLKNERFRSIVVELLPRVSELRRGPDPTRHPVPTPFGIPVERIEQVAAVAELARVRPHFVHESAAVYRMEITAGSAVTVEGPAVVGCPYQLPVEMEKSGERPVRFESFLQMKWLGPGEAATLRSSQTASVRAIAVQVGSRNEESLPVQARYASLKSLKVEAERPK